MLVYRPSRGNDSVTLTYTGEWAGLSLGREIVIKDKFGPSDYFLWYQADLSSDSTWFYKPVTNLDFTTGLTYYRAIYIGPHEKENLQEYIGTISSSVTTCTSGSSTPDVEVSMWAEGIFTTISSKQSILLDNEFDTTGKLQNGTFSTSLPINQTLTVGQWLKIWVKISVPINLSLVDIENLCYTLSVGSLSIKINKAISRLSLSRVFHGNLVNDDITTKELIPTINEMGKIHKVINLEPNQTHIFYNTVDGDFHNLIVERHNNAYDNKFIDVNASPVTGPITGFDTFSDSLKAVQDVFTCMVSGDLNQKYIVDIFASKLPDRSYFYIFYNQLSKFDDGLTVSTSSETYSRYDANYGHTKYR